jgi:hypothetical protein
VTPAACGYNEEWPGGVTDPGYNQARIA